MTKTQREGDVVGQKDMVEKLLEGYSDVFADIINGLVFQGKQVVSPEDLREATPRSMYKAGMKYHEQERDIAKYWVIQRRKGARIVALLALENQTEYDPDAAPRMIGYDGASYRGQLLKKPWRKTKKLYPVMTLVLNFGKKAWGSVRSLHGRMQEMPEEMKKYVNDYQVHVFDIAYLSDEEISRFHSDFRIVAKFFAKLRTDPENAMNDVQEFVHTDEMLKLFAVIMNDERYTEWLKKNEGGQPKNMREVWDRIEKIGQERGEKIGEKRGQERGEKIGEKRGQERGEKIGEKRGEEKLITLLMTLQKENRQDAMNEAMRSKEVRDRLYREYQLV